MKMSFEALTQAVLSLSADEKAALLECLQSSPLAHEAAESLAHEQAPHPSLEPQPQAFELAQDPLLKLPQEDLNALLEAIGSQWT